MFAVECPTNSLECSDQRQYNPAGWITLSAVLALFVVPDIIDGMYLFYESSTSQEFHFLELSEIHLRVVFGVMLMSVPIMSIAASFIYLYATSISNASLLKDSIGEFFIVYLFFVVITPLSYVTIVFSNLPVILFLSEIDEQTFKVMIRLFPSWNDSIEQDVVDHRYEQVDENQDYNHAVNDNTGRDRGAQHDDPPSMMQLAAKKDSESLSKFNTSGDLIGITSSPETEEPSRETHHNDRVDALELQVETLTSQMQKMNNALNAKDSIILEIWNVLSREHFQFADAEMNKTIDVGELNSDSKFPKTSQNMKKESQQLMEVEDVVKRNPLASFHSSNFSVRQAKAQELDTKIRDHCELLYNSRRSSLDIFENDDMNKLSSTSNSYAINRSIEDLNINTKSTLVTARNEAGIYNKEFKSYSTSSANTAHAEVEPSSHTKRNDVLLPKREIAHPDHSIIDGNYKNERNLECQESSVESKIKKQIPKNSVTADDTTNTTCADENTALSQLCDSGLFFRTFDLQLNVANEDSVDGDIFMEIDERDYTFDGDGS